MTKTLSNGNNIWDFAGNILEWTNAKITKGQPTFGSIDNGYESLEWNKVESIGNISVNPLPSGTSITGSNSWTASSNKLGFRVTK